MFAGLFRLAAVSAAAMGLAQPIAVMAQQAPAEVVIAADSAGPIIDRDIFGQFAEHLGEGIYGGVWVGPDSPIPNVRGIRSDVVAALRQLKIPNVRWPGGCYADVYHWRDGIGPARQRPKRLNAQWGNVIEDNRFGTHEFMDFIDQIDSEAYIVANVGTGSPREAAEWLEYMTTDQPSTLGLERQANGRKEPWPIKYLGIGNESWSCGGSMSPAVYVQNLKTFTTFAQGLNPRQSSPIRWIRSPNDIKRIAVGPDGAHTEYTEAVMDAWKQSHPWTWGFEGLALHFYAMGSNPMSSPATGFDSLEYARFVKETIGIEGMIEQHSAIMDRHDPEKKVALVVDEWGAWLGPMAGTNPRFLKQQNSMRDAILAALNLNIFARHADRVRTANVAQMVNVLQSMILTEGDRMLLTPTYHAFRMYVPFQDARLLPVTLDRGTYAIGGIAVPKVDALAARSGDGTVWLSLVNVDPDQPASLKLRLPGVPVRQAIGQTLTAPAIDTINTFEQPAAVSPTPASFAATGNALEIQLPPRSVSVLKLVQ